ncbi:hypothetical protein HMI48_00530 [Acidithiobacillus ferrooxidans]|uniref:hypothetical protein n=1 Tax=Acidithiobacillus ferrooxidans TaxID=920 RepID=UPI001C079A18|nr:hypothetical protein [Acidithiobacillus ferrooxidans]MBU2772447.1 hypothetical protein [Acidithiobacillus ferrooxidans]
MKKAHALLGALITAGLAGCATTPNMHYSGVAPQASVQHKNVALVTKVTDGYFNPNVCVFGIAKKCSELTFSKNSLVSNYDKLLSSALKQSGALATVAPSVPATGWCIKSSIGTLAPAKSETVVHYDLGKTLGMGLIPVYGLFTPHYYTMDVNLVDDVTIFHDGKAVWHDRTPVHMKKNISGSRFKIGGTHSEAAYKVYREAQTSAVSQTMVGLGQVMSKSG